MQNSATDSAYRSPNRSRNPGSSDVFVAVTKAADDQRVAKQYVRTRSGSLATVRLNSVGSFQCERIDLGIGSVRKNNDGQPLVYEALNGCPEP